MFQNLQFTEVVLQLPVLPNDMQNPSTLGRFLLTLTIDKAISR